MPDPLLPRSYPLRTSTMVVALRIMAIQLIAAPVTLLLVSLVALFNSLSGGYVSPLLSPGGVVMLMAILDAVIIALIILDWQRTAYIIRPGEAEIDSGIFQVQEMTYKVRAPETVITECGFWGRLLNYGTIRFASDMPHKEVALVGIPDPEQYADLLRQSPGKPELRWGL